MYFGKCLFSMNKTWSTTGTKWMLNKRRRRQNKILYMWNVNFRAHRLIFEFNLNEWHVQKWFTIEMVPWKSMWNQFSEMRSNENNKILKKNSSISYGAAKNGKWKIAKHETNVNKISIGYRMWLNVLFFVTCSCLKLNYYLQLKITSHSLISTS